MCHLVLTRPRASTPEIMETPDDDVQEPVPKAHQRRLIDVHEARNAEVHSSLEIAGPVSCSGQAVSGNNTDNSRNN